MAKRQKKQTVTQEIMSEVRKILSSYSNDVTRSNYYRILRNYIAYCRKNHNIQSLTDAAKLEYVQKYADSLVSSDTHLSPFTIHTYLSGITSVVGTIDSRIKLASIQKPTRVVGHVFRGRRKENETELNPKYERVIRFCKAVGIRRAEMTRLRGCDFHLKDDGTAKIVVYRGKGGKRQQQAIFSDIEFVKSCFEGVGENEKVFTKSELNCRINIHKYRALHAQEAYTRCEEILKTPGGEEKLKREVIEYWNQFKKVPFPMKMIEGTYTLRGETRKMALAQIRKGHPFIKLHYSKLALLHTSMYALSHLRTGVTMHYMLYTDVPTDA